MLIGEGRHEGVHLALLLWNSGFLGLFEVLTIIKYKIHCWYRLGWVLVIPYRKIAPTASEEVLLDTSCDLAFDVCRIYMVCFQSQILIRSLISTVSQYKIITRHLSGSSYSLQQLEQYVFFCVLAILFFILWPPLAEYFCYVSAPDALSRSLFRLVYLAGMRQDRFLTD